MRNKTLASAFNNTISESRQELLQLKNSMQAFHEDEHGDNENLGRMLVLGLILVPIVILLVVYGGNVKDEVARVWGELKFGG